MSKSTHSLPPNALNFISQLSALSPAPTEIWLFGSFANGRSQPNSDIDLLVFGSKKLIETIRSNINQPHNIDCLIVYDGENYEDPWQEKSGSLSALKWERINKSTARYTGISWVPDQEFSDNPKNTLGDLIKTNYSSYRLWPES